MNSLCYIKALFVLYFLLILPQLAFTFSSELNNSIECHSFFSNSLNKRVDFSIYIPQQTPPENGWPMLFLLHGRGRNYRSVIDDSLLVSFVLKQPYVIVFPNGDDGWYIDSPVVKNSKYQSMLLELLTQIRSEYPVSNQIEKTGVAGWSMGGFGAVRLAQDSELFGAVATTIGLMDYPNPNLDPEQNYKKGRDVPTVFTQDTLVWKRYNCLTNAHKLSGKRVLIIGGRGGADLHMNFNFHNELLSEGIPHKYISYNGEHVWSTVQATLPVIFDFMNQVFYLKSE